MWLFYMPSPKTTPTNQAHFHQVIAESSVCFYMFDRKCFGDVQVRQELSYACFPTNHSIPPVKPTVVLPSGKSVQKSESRRMSNASKCLFVFLFSLRWVTSMYINLWAKQVSASAVSTGIFLKWFKHAFLSITDINRCEEQL